MAAKGSATYVVDFLVGVGASIVILGAGAGLSRHQYVVVVAMIAAGVTATVLRAGQMPNVAWMRGLLVGIGIAGPLVMLALFVAGAKGNPAAWVFLMSALFGCAGVAEVTALFRSGSRVSAAAVCVCAVAAVSLLWTVGLRLIMPKPKMVTMDKPLPELALRRMNGTPIASSELQGHVTVMDFWGTWCPPCVEEMPVLNEVAASYSGDSRVQFLLVNPEMNGDDLGKIGAFVKKRGVTLPVALDPSQTCFKLGPVLFPMTVVVDRRGHMRYERSGYAGAAATRKELRGEVDELLKE